MGKSIAAFPWGTTALGPLALWPAPLRTMVNTMLATPVPMVVLWGDELLFLHNDAYAALAGEHRPENLGRPAREVWSELAGFLEPIFKQLKEGGDAVDYTDRRFHVRRGGAVVDAWFNVAYSAIRDVAPRTLGLLVVVQETSRYIIAERRLHENQQLLADIVDSTPELIFALDREQRYLLVNAEMATFVGLPKEQIVGRPLHSLYPPDTTEMLTRHNEQILQSGTTSVSELQLQPLGGVAKTLLVTKFPIRNSGGDITGIGGVAVDITARKQLEEELLAAKTRAEDSLRMKTTFLDIAAHELRNPITVLSLLLQLYQDATQDGGTIGAPDLERLREPIDRLSRLVVELLNVARLERGMVVLHRQDTDLGRLVMKCVEEFRVIAPAREIRLALPALSIVASVDPVRLHQVFANLLDNALKYAPDGPIDVLLEQLPTTVRVSVTDHGPGIAASSLDALFEAFARDRAEAVLTRPPGLGLGLSVCRAIVLLHGGTIDVRTNIGKGSTFFVDLPFGDR
jgi:PAS domain S-box-containing protein